MLKNLAIYIMADLSINQVADKFAGIKHWNLNVSVMNSNIVSIVVMHALKNNKFIYGLKPDWVKGQMGHFLQFIILSNITVTDNIY